MNRRRAGFEHGQNLAPWSWVIQLAFVILVIATVIGIGNLIGNLARLVAP